MGALDWIILGVIALAVIAAVVSMLRNRGRSCCGDCTRCGRACGDKMQDKR